MERGNCRLDELDTRESWREACGLFGIYGPGLDVAHLTYLGLYALQHRGQESAGIAVADGREIKLQKAMGLVTEVFCEEDLAKLKGHLAVGHVRYSTTGTSSLVNAQPLVFHYSRGMLALVHNGNLTNASHLFRTLSSLGSVFQTTTDSELIVNLIAHYGQETVEEAIQKCMADLRGAYALLIMTEDKLIGVRDPQSLRPLCLGCLGDAYVLASESCALDTIEAKFIRDLVPGEVVVIGKEGVCSYQSLPSPSRALCVFEYVYFARPDSILDGRTVASARREMGRELAREHLLPVDSVIPVPDSGTAAALGYAEAAGLPFREGLMRNRYIGRTFIQPVQKVRDLGVRLKLNPVREVLAGKRIALVDDSIVRGTTSRKIVRMLREAGATEVHFLVSSPPILYPCYYGIDTSARGELIAAQHSVDEIREFIGADSLYYLSLEGLLRAVGGEAEGFCAACFNGKYPTELPPEEEQGKYILEGKPGGKRA